MLFSLWKIMGAVSCVPGGGATAPSHELATASRAPLVGSARTSVWGPRVSSTRAASLQTEAEGTCPLLGQHVLRDTPRT